MPSQQPTVRRAADTWFLQRGLPAVLRPGALARRVWPRSAPALSAFAVFMVNSAVVVFVTGQHTISIEGTPTRTDWFILGLLVLVLPLAVTVGWWVSKISDVRARAIAATAAVAIAVAGGVPGGPSPRVIVDLVFEGIVIAGILALTACGAGSILGWAVHKTLSHLTAAGSPVIRALPVLLLTFLVFFNSPVWLMASTVSRPRLWLALLFMTGIAAVFVVTSSVERFRSIIGPDTEHQGARLAGTPFETMPDPPHRTPLTHTERLNVLFVLAASQLAQILAVAVVTALLFFILGLILLSPELLAEWTHGGSSDGTFLSMTIPVPEALIQITLFLGALTFMYISARAAGDAQYRSQFLDPVLDDLHLTLTARDRYRAFVSAR